MYKLFKWLFKSKVKDDNFISVSEITEDEVYFHEDSYCQIEFLHKSKLSQVMLENTKLDILSKDKFDGFGFTDLYIRDQKDLSIKDYKISSDCLKNFLNSYGCKKAAKVFTGYGQIAWECHKINSYKYETIDFFIKSETDIVSSFWIDFNYNNFKIKETSNLLYEIGLKFNLVINDWYTNQIIDLSNTETIEEYLFEKLDI